MRQTLGYDMTFQSTLPRRERRLVAAVVLNRVISIHAPAKGATDAILKSTDLRKISIHAPAKGATFPLKIF